VLLHSVLVGVAAAKITADASGAGKRRVSHRRAHLCITSVADRATTLKGQCREIPDTEGLSTT
jgi:hypothetical protein